QRSIDLFCAVATSVDLNVYGRLTFLVMNLGLFPIRTLEVSRRLDPQPWIALYERSKNFLQRRHRRVSAEAPDIVAHDRNGSTRAHGAGLTKGPVIDEWDRGTESIGRLRSKLRTY